MKPKVIAVVGATASGKTAYAIELAKRLDGEVVSADSRLVYKGFDIGAAKPTKEEMDGIPHHMIDIVTPEFDYSAGIYTDEAKRAVDDILSRGKTPIIAGGTGLYFRLLLEGYDVPKVEPDYELREKLSNLSWEELSKMLQEIAPDKEFKIELNDKKKIIRAIELAKHIEKPLHEHKKDSDYDVEWVGRNFERPELYERINKRVDLMIKNGLIEETEKLLKKHGRIKNITETIGYREIIAYLDGTMTLDDAILTLKQNTRNYAKRQLTWFRKNPFIQWNIEPKKLKK